MKHGPMLFQTDMVRAIRDGRKTQTRRIIKAIPPNAINVRHNMYLGLTKFGPYDGSGPWGNIKFHHGVPGDRIWVKETWRTWKSLDDVKPVNIREGAGIEYCAGGTNILRHDVLHDAGRWRPSIFMRQWMSRLELEIEWVRVQRLQDISEEDAVAEGMFKWDGTLGKGSAVTRYAMLWEKINGKGSWAANPYVWAITFRRVP